MKISRREQTLLAILGAVVIVGGGYYAVLKPQYNEVKAMEIKAQESNAYRAQVEADIKPDSKIHTDFKFLSSQVQESSQSYFPTILQDKIILNLKQLLVQANLAPLNFNFPNVEVGEIKDKKQEGLVKEYTIPLSGVKEEFNGAVVEKKEEEKTEANNKKEENPYVVEKLNLTLTVEGDYPNLVKFLEQVEMLNRKILIKNITTSKDENKPLKHTITMEFYAIPKLHEQDEEYFGWDLQRIYGRSNPFIPFSGTMTGGSGASGNISTNNTGNGATNVSVQKQSDFVMSVKPITADYPTVIIGKTKATDTKANIYADNPSVESVAIEVYEKNNQYYYRYKTQNESYPSNYAEGVPFKPTGGSHKLTIVSSKRNGPKDLSGVNLSVTNKTGLQFDVFIQDDDKSKPRVNVVKSGNVVIHK